MTYFNSKKLSILVVSFAMGGSLLTVFQNCAPTGINNSNMATNLKLSGSSLNQKNSVIPSFTNLAQAKQIDDATPNCTSPVLVGWKCSTISVVNSDGESYQVLLKWSRPNIDSIGTVVIATGGSGRGESRVDPPSKLMHDELSDLDHIRVIQIEFIDQPTATNTWGGYMSRSGGYRSAGSAFAAAIKYVVDKQIVRGSFLNYLGGSNATAIAAYAMSHLGIDQYFDRVVFQMGPFLPSLKTACDRNSKSSIFLNTPKMQEDVFNLMNAWRYGDTRRNICDDQSDDRMSMIGQRRDFPNTHIHVIIGALEEEFGYGPWMLNSNLEWFNSVSGKSKERIIRPDLAHNNSYKDMRRFLKLPPNRVAASIDPEYVDEEGSFCKDGRVVKFNCRAGAQITPPTFDTRIPWVNVGMTGGKTCFHLPTQNSCDGKNTAVAVNPPASNVPTWGPNPTTQPQIGPTVVGPAAPPTDRQPAAANSCVPSRGEFKDSSQRTIVYSCGCKAAPTTSTGWVAQADGCFHRVSKEAPVAAPVSCTYGSFVNKSQQVIEWACSCPQAPNGSGWVPQADGCFQRQADEIRHYDSGYDLGVGGE